MEVGIWKKCLKLKLNCEFISHGGKDQGFSGWVSGSLKSTMKWGRWNEFRRKKEAGKESKIEGENKNKKIEKTQIPPFKAMETHVHNTWCTQLAKINGNKWKGTLTQLFAIAMDTTASFIIKRQLVIIPKVKGYYCK